MKKKQNYNTYTYTHSKYIINTYTNTNTLWMLWTWRQLWRLCIYTNWSNNSRITDYWNFLKKHIQYIITDYGLRICCFSEIYEYTYGKHTFKSTTLCFSGPVSAVQPYYHYYHYMLFHISVLLIKHKWSVYIVYMLDMFLSEIRFCLY